MPKTAAIRAGAALLVAAVLVTLNRGDKLPGLVFESGRNSANYPLIRSKFALPYVD